MKKILIVLALFASYAHAKSEQCVVIRDDANEYEIEVPKNVPIFTKQGWVSFDTPKKITSNQFSQIKLTEANKYSAQLMLRIASTGEFIGIFVSVSNYVKGAILDQLYPTDSTPRIFVRSASQDNEFEVHGSSLYHVQKGNPFYLDINVITCSDFGPFAADSKQILDNPNPDTFQRQILQ